MTNSLLIVAWPYDGEILTSFRYASAYAMPDLYTGDATLTQISSTMNATHYTLIFRCQNCLSWSQDGVSNKVSTSSRFWLMGWAQAFPAPGNAQCPDEITLLQHDNGMNLFPATLGDEIANPSYTAWAAKATKTVTGECGGASQTSISSVPVPTGVTYDYIVVGGGAGGIPIADKLSEAGKSVLLIEKGPPSSGRWGGTMKPDWLDGTNLTRFDVPGLCNEIWVDANGIACTDTDQMAGCVLGGGTAVNAGLWWKVSSMKAFQGHMLAGNWRFTNACCSHTPWTGTTTFLQDGSQPICLPQQAGYSPVFQGRTRHPQTANCISNKASMSSAVA